MKVYGDQFNRSRAIESDLERLDRWIDRERSGTSGIKLLRWDRELRSYRGCCDGVGSVREDVFGRNDEWEIGYE